MKRVGNDHAGTLNKTDKLLNFWNKNRGTALAYLIVAKANASQLKSTAPRKFRSKAVDHTVRMQAIKKYIAFFTDKFFIGEIGPEFFPHCKCWIENALRFNPKAREQVNGALLANGNHVIATELVS